ncbi:MAG: SgcJ/EcaC family oxidoreductase [Acidimicrobiia bacterium]|nr:SgcJ/EcaC family oxidoreductase [Acidimicrobiia bacterium]
MSGPSELDDLEELHGRILEAWNRQDAAGYADCFDDDALVIGLDGSEMHGRASIEEQLGSIFADHQVASYVRVVRSTQRVDTSTAVLHAVVGMIPPRRRRRPA